MAYSPGTLVNIAATPAAGYQFIGWSGDASGAQNPLVVTMTRNMRITAVFNPVPPSTYTIDLVVSTVSDVGVGGTVSKSPNLPFYSAGAEVQVTASANAGHAFTGWRRSGFGAANPLGVLMHSNREVVANFAQMSPSTTVLALGLPFTHNVPGTAGGSRGKVSNMGNSGTMHWQASPTVSWIQVNSSGNSIPRGGDNPLVLYFEENPTTSPRSGEVYVTAPGAQNSPQIYTIVQAAGLPRYSLTVAAENGIVTKSPDQSTYAQGSQVQVTATPAAGYIFTGWTGDLSGTQTPVTVTVDGNKSIAANFLWLRNPDLVPKFVLQDSIAFQGGRTAYGGSVSNRGADASAPFKLYYRISNSSVLPPTINVSGEAPFMDFPNIGAVTEVPLSGNLDIPSSLALGSYYVWFLVDPENKAGEQSSTRSNNNIALPISVLPDTSAPVVNIAVPAGGANVTTISSSIDVAGTATDNVAVAEITWNNDRGGNGTTQGTANWSISGITLLPGNNVINVSARDAAGNQTTVTVTVSYNAPDLTPPAVTIAFPSIESTFGTSDGQLNVSGIATDDRGVAVVTWTNNRGGNGSASGTAVWERKRNHSTGGLECNYGDSH